MRLDAAVLKCLQLASISPRNPLYVRLTGLLHLIRSYHVLFGEKIREMVGRFSQVSHQRSSAAPSSFLRFEIIDLRTRTSINGLSASDAELRFPACHYATLFTVRSGFQGLLLQPLRRLPASLSCVLVFRALTLYGLRVLTCQAYSLIRTISWSDSRKNHSLAVDLSCNLIAVLQVASGA